MLVSSRRTLHNINVDNKDKNKAEFTKNIVQFYQSQIKVDCFYPSDSNLILGEMKKYVPL